MSWTIVVAVLGSLALLIAWAVADLIQDDFDQNRVDRDHEEDL